MKHETSAGRVKINNDSKNGKIKAIRNNQMYLIPNVFYILLLNYTV